MFDFTVSAPWPKGVYLCKKLQEAGKTVCYAETAPEEPPPFGFFAGEEREEEKSFLLSLGELKRQEGGFCLVEGRKVRRLQDIAGSFREKSAGGKRTGRQTASSPPLRPLEFFAFQFRSRIFDIRPSFFALSQEAPPPLDLFQDYFLFRPSLKKKRRFQKENGSIHWLRADAAKEGGEGGAVGGARTETNPPAAARFGSEKEKGRPSTALPESKRIARLNQPSFSACPPDWLWDSFAFSAAGLKEYEAVLPSHFVLISRPLHPWTEDNLLNVFKKGGGEWAVRVRRSFWTDSEGRERLRRAAGRRLEGFFKTPFQERAPPEETESAAFKLAVYGGRESLSYLKRARPGWTSRQEDLMERLLQEKALARRFMG